MERKKLVVDIDGTICTLTNGDYDKAIPIHAHILALNHLHETGKASIVYYTGRGWDKYEYTRSQLRLWNCRFDQLICGKPLGDVYIDDLSIDSVAKLDLFLKDKQ